MLLTGTQTWSKKNLNVSAFRIGEPIWHAKGLQEWKDTAEGGFPAWKQLIDFLGGEEAACIALMAADQWFNFHHAEQHIDIKGLAAGGRNKYGSFSKLGDFAYWWRSSEHNQTKAISLQFDLEIGSIRINPGDKGSGFGVRYVLITYSDLKVIYSDMRLFVLQNDTCLVKDEVSEVRVVFEKKYQQLQQASFCIFKVSHSFMPESAVSSTDKAIPAKPQLVSLNSLQSAALVPGISIEATPLEPVSYCDYLLLSIFF